MIATTCRAPKKARPHRKSTLQPRRRVEAALRRRAHALAERVIEFMPNPEFAKSNPASLAELPAQNATGEAPRSNSREGLGRYMASLYETPLLTREQEVDYFRRLNLYKYHAACKQVQIDLENPDAHLLDEIERLLDAAHDMRDRIIRANLRLVVSIAKRFSSDGYAFQDLVSDGHLSLMRAVEKFDFALGFRFSTYATWAIRKNFGRLIQRQRQNRMRFVPTEEQFFRHTSDQRNDERSEQNLGRVRTALSKILDRLPDRERTIVNLRYGLDEAGHVHTLQEIATDMGVCKERIRQIELRALRKLHAFAVDERIEPPAG